MRDEYDFASGVRGKYATRFAAGSNVVILDPDVAKRFGDSASVNDALRSLLDGGSAKPPPDLPRRSKHRRRRTPAER